MPARLTVHFPSRPARVLLLPEGGRTVVGRDPDCDLVLDDDRVSRRHAVVASDASGWTIADLGSKNGTLIDGLPAAERALGERSWISFGGLVARFERFAGTVERLEEERLRRFSTSLELQRGLAPEAGLAELLPRVVASMAAASASCGACWRPAPRWSARTRAPTPSWAGGRASWPPASAPCSACRRTRSTG
jgi:hypothetical protein